jgi:hypothetical protein
MARNSHHTSLFTINRDDVYDYLRCPKIVALKVMLAMRDLSQPAEKPKPTIPRFELRRWPQMMERAVNAIGKASIE